MGTENLANASVVYRSKDGADKTCVDALKDDAHYKFTCRCGCGGGFAGFGRDIKASGEVGRIAPPPTTTVAGDGTAKIFYDTSTSANMTTPSTADVEIKNVRAELALRIRPFVSDRYIKKAIFGLTDDEIDALQDEEKIELADRDPPGMGDLAWSLSTKAGPFVVLDYSREELEVNKKKHTVWHAIVKTAKGNLTTFPIADLVAFKDMLPAEAIPRTFLGTLKLVALSALIAAGSAACAIGVLEVLDTLRGL